MISWKEQTRSTGSKKELVVLVPLANPNIIHLAHFIGFVLISWKEQTRSTGSEKELVVLVPLANQNIIHSAHFSGDILKQGEHDESENKKNH